MANKLRSNKIEDIYSGKNNAGTTYTSKKKTSIQGFGEEEIKENLKKIKQQQKAEEAKKKKEEEKNKRVSFFKFNKLILASYFLMLIGIIVSLAFSKIDYVFYSIITIFMSIYLNRRLKFNNVNMELVNVLLWNLTNALNDFIKYQISPKLLEKNQKQITIACSVFMILLVLLPSNNVIFIIGLIAVFGTFIVALANKDMALINEKVNFLIIMTVLGFFVKIAVPLFWNQTFYIDFGFIILLNLFVAIDFFTKNITIHQPITHG